VSPRPRSVSDAAILAATGRVISRCGPGGLTLAAVAADAGMAASSLVERFGDKRALLLAFAAEGGPALRRAFARARARHANPLAALRAGLRTIGSAVRSRTQLANHLAFLQMDLRDAAFRAHAVAHGLALREELTSLLEQANARGLTDVPAGAAARELQVAYNGALVTWAIHGEGTVARAIDDAVSAVLGRHAQERGAQERGARTRHRPRTTRPRRRPRKPVSG
jgi:AcrR family transcriptional regulator